MSLGIQNPPQLRRFGHRSANLACGLLDRARYGHELGFRLLTFPVFRPKFKYVYLMLASLLRSSFH